MAEQDLLFTFGADITDFKGNIQQVIDQIKKVREEIKTASAGDLPKLNAQLSELTSGLQRLKTVGVPAADGIKKVRDSASDARVALTNVSQVVQDLPFGFIGIQNNIPGVIQAFGNLTSGSTGLVGGLKAISAQLLGPAGIFLAFSVVTSAVTGLITKYGSLGAGLEAVFGSTVKLTQAQKDYNKALSESIGSSASEVVEINALVKILGDLSKPLQERYSAYVELNKIRPEVVAGISEESLAIGNYTKQLDINATAIRNLIFLEAKRAALTSVINKNVAEQTTLEQDRPRLIADLLKAQKDEIESAKKIEQGLKTQGRFRTQESQNLLLATKAYTDNINKQNELIKSYREYADSLTPVITNIANVDGATKKLTDSLKKQDEVVKKPKKGRAGLFDYLVTEVDKGLIPISKLEGKLANLLKPNLSPFQFQTPNLKNPLQNQIDALKLFVQKSEEAKNQFKDFFFDPVNALFTNFFETGKFTIQAFGDVLLAQVKKIVAELITSKILSLIASLIPGVGAGSAALKAGSAIGSFLSAGGSLLGRGAANFGGVQGGGMGMSGSVNLTLRGSDLVGAINRTNSQIQRVG
jgi:hypothetical protein